MPVTTELWRQRQESKEFSHSCLYSSLEANLGYERPSLKNQTNRENVKEMANHITTK